MEQKKDSFKVYLGMILSAGMAAYFVSGLLHLGTGKNVKRK